MDDEFNIVHDVKAQLPPQEVGPFLFLLPLPLPLRATLLPVVPTVGKGASLNDTPQLSTREPLFASATGAELAALIELLQPALIDKPLSHVIMASIALCLVSLHPDITADQLKAGVQSISAWMVTYVDNISLTANDKLLLSAPITGKPN